MVICVVGSFFLFFWLDRLLHTGGWLWTVGLLLGIATGGFTSYRLTIRMFRREENSSETID
ncbi:MAG: AtpZ/AtpI family protein [Candidatus Cloacimonetes bacterium]|nr:AtpZ/AtpI family protein [Candidatus Cloacimonadota bacterium]